MRPERRFNQPENNTTPDGVADLSSLSFPGATSECSATCGVGVPYQTRKCLFAEWVYLHKIMLKLDWLYAFFLPVRIQRELKKRWT